MTNIEDLFRWVLRRMGGTPQHKWDRPVAWNTLRVDGSDGSLVVEYRIGVDTQEQVPVVEYRIENAEAERMTTGTTTETCQETEVEWHRFTPEQLTLHITENAVVKYWLSHRMGPDTLSRACAPERDSASSETRALQRHPRRTSGAFGPLQPITE